MLAAMRDLYQLEVGAPAMPEWPRSNAPRPDDADLVEALRRECGEIEQRARAAIAQRDAIVAQLEAELQLARRRRPRASAPPTAAPLDNEPERLSRVLARVNSELAQCRQALQAESEARAQAEWREAELRSQLEAASERHAHDAARLTAKARRRQARAEDAERRFVQATREMDAARKRARDAEAALARERNERQRSEHDDVVRALAALETKAELVRLTDALPL